MWQHVKLSEQIRPWDTLACCWDVKQPTNKQTLNAHNHLAQHTTPISDWTGVTFHYLLHCGLATGELWTHLRDNSASETVCCKIENHTPFDSIQPQFLAESLILPMLLTYVVMFLLLSFSGLCARSIHMMYRQVHWYYSFKDSVSVWIFCWLPVNEYLWNSSGKCCACQEFWDWWLMQWLWKSQHQN